MKRPCVNEGTDHHFIPKRFRKDTFSGRNSEFKTCVLCGYIEEEKEEEK